MTNPTISATTRQFIDYLHRGGAVDYTWAVKGKAKISNWRIIGEGDITLLNSQHNMYFGVHPSSAIPATNSKGESKDAKSVRSQKAYIAAINCVYGEFDAKRWAPATDEEAHAELGSDGREHDTIEDARSRVQERIFVQDSETYKARALAHITSLPLAASIIVDSGGGYHAYWLLRDTFMLNSDEARTRADRTQKGWVKIVGSDDDAKDLTRVLRIPDTRNFKAAYAPNYPAVSFVEINFDSTYLLEDIEALLPVDPKRKTQETRERGMSATTHTPTPAIKIDFNALADRVVDATLWIKRLSTDRRDGYNSWLNVGMSVHELGDIGFELWKAWSQESPRYRVGDCEAKWETIRDGNECGGLTLASLKRWAEEDTPEDIPIAPQRVVEELKTLREEKETHDKILAHPTLGDREKVAWLATNQYINAQLKRHPSGSISLSGKRVGDSMGRSASTGNRAIRMLEKHGVLVCDPAPMTLSDGTEVAQMLVQPGPAFEDPTQVQPIGEVKQRGGARAGAGRKAKCEAHPEARIFRYTEVRYVCEECGDLLYEEPTKIKVFAPDEEINFDSEESTDEAAPASVECAHADVPEINSASNTPLVNKARNSARPDPYEYPPGFVPGLLERLRERQATQGVTP